VSDAEKMQPVAPRIVVVGDIHAQVAKFWHILREAGVVDSDCQASSELREGQTQLVLLGDLVHAKSRAHYAALISESGFDEFHPPHVRRAELAQEVFLRSVKQLCDQAPGSVTILLGNHDHNALTGAEGTLRSDDLSHLEWHASGRTLPDDLRAWLETWPSEVVVAGVHFAHVGPKPEHNRYDALFYLENRRDWILEGRDVMAETPHRFGVYGHTPVRGGAHFASQGRALLLDMNSYGDEYAYLVLSLTDDAVRLELRGLFFSAVL
jgi:hypothetical protein